MSPSSSNLGANPDVLEQRIPNLYGSRDWFPIEDNFPTQQRGGVGVGVVVSDEEWL